MAGIFYGWIGVYYGELAQMVDTWAYHFESLKETASLKSNPLTFFTDIFSNSYKNGYYQFFSSENSWWNDLKSNFFIKILAIFNLLSFGNYYINVIFYSFISLFGPIAVYRVMQREFPLRKFSILVACFIIPSFLYWTSGIHKEGIIYSAIGMIIYSIYFGIKDKHFGAYKIGLIIFGFILILALRNFLILPLVPPLIAWMIAEKLKNRYRPSIIFLITGFLFIILFFVSGYISSNTDLPSVVVNKQQEFIGLQGGSSVAVNRLHPNLLSFISNAPQAFSLSVLRPYPSDVKHLLSLAASLEINGLLLIFVIFIFWHRPLKPPSPFILFCFFFSFAVLMMIGYTVNVLGAIVRYRSIVLPFLIVPLFAKVNWTRINSYILGKI